MVVQVVKTSSPRIEAEKWHLRPLESGQVRHGSPQVRFSHKVQQGDFPEVDPKLQGLLNCLKILDFTIPYLSTETTREVCKGRMDLRGYKDFC
uniref:Uncharacterized protein n=1 Tax=Utricularia reniformis TaxID=192314 RepID=A0A1Y0B2Z0_9LAMI|nr:hypothetical protein AEK19_MT1622 [Utricularia reniformis]ART31806.1 hypothetical protein AEK19_MT1622 [Utricularia reniformis]